MGLVVYISFLIKEMYAGVEDTYSKNDVINTFEEPYNQFNMSNYKFMPSIAV